MFEKQRINTVLKEHGMHPGCIDLDAELETYKQEMRDGLAKKDGSSLMMLPTYVGTFDSLPKDESAIVIDAGGTNLRVGRVRFGKDGGISVERVDRYAMPGTEKSITKEEMFSEIAGHVLPLLQGGDRIGFCFSFVFESLPNHDGIIEAMSKEVDVAGVGGAHACTELEAALVRAGAPGGGRRYVMINDTVATLLGARAVHTDIPYCSHVGMILGTGMNACYIEQTSNIGKLEPGVYAGDNMVVNMEAGIYTGLAQGTVDKQVDKASQYPGDHVYEKMISGGYFGHVLYGTFKLLWENGLFSGGFAEAMKPLRKVSLKEITRYIEGTADENNLYAQLAAKNADDRQTLDYALELLYERCAKMVVIMLCGIAGHTQSGADAAHPLCVCAEGTTFYRSPLLTKYLDILMRDYVAGQHGRHIRIVSTDDATLTGTALAALTN